MASSMVNAMIDDMALSMDDAMGGPINVEHWVSGGTGRAGVVRCMISKSPAALGTKSTFLEPYFRKHSKWLYKTSSFGIESRGN